MQCEASAGDAEHRRFDQQQNADHPEHPGHDHPHTGAQP
jgi:hypothetical protein